MKDETRKTEAFLERWSRLKRQAESAAAPAPAKDPSPSAPELPPLEKLSFDSDFRGFLHGKVEEQLRRAALKKLFGDPRFNTIDPLDIYIEDYSLPDPIPPEMLKNLTQYESLFGKPEEERPPREPGEPQEPASAQPAGEVAALPQGDSQPTPDAGEHIEGHGAKDKVSRTRDGSPEQG